jgi:hypothetical protein
VIKTGGFAEHQHAGLAGPATAGKQYQQAKGKNGCNYMIQAHRKPGCF